MKNLTPELIEKAKTAKTAEELLALAKENGVELSEESAVAYFAQMNPPTGELSDDELDNVSGGGCYNDDRLVVTVGNICSSWRCKNCDDHHIYNIERNSWDIHTCPEYCGGGKVAACCDTCVHCSYERGLWLCNCLSNRKG